MSSLSRIFNDFSRAEERVRAAYDDITRQGESRELVAAFMTAYGEMAEIGNYLVYIRPETTMREILQIDRKRDEWRPVYLRYRELT